MIVKEEQTNGTLPSTSFSSIPTINFQHFHNDETKSHALEQLRDALFKVGFLYLVDTGLESIIAEAQDMMPTIFGVSDSDKEQCNMIHSPSFLGYTALGAETTASRNDLREQFDFGTPTTDLWKDGDPMWQRLEGPSQYPNPQTEQLVNNLISKISSLADLFLELVAECLSLPHDTFLPYRGNMDRLKFVRYPQSAPGSQGVGPHKDSTGLFTFLAQDSVGGLQVLNKAGEWIDAPPVQGSLVVNIAQGFEAITAGLCSATAHRVIAPIHTTRYSIPYFLAVRNDLTLPQLKGIANEISQRVPVIDPPKNNLNQIASEFLSPSFSCFGEASLRNRIISHPDVGKAWYPELFERYSREKFQ